MVTTVAGLATVTGLSGSANAQSDRVNILDRPRHGRDALERVRNSLPAVSQLNGLEPARLQALLDKDSTAWLDRQGRVHFVDPATNALQGGTTSATSASAAAPIAYDQTFALHSRPGAIAGAFSPGPR